MTVWAELFIAMGGAATLGSVLAALAQHWLETWKARHPPEASPQVKARNTISLHSALGMLRDIHRTAVKQGYVDLEDLEEASAIYNAYHTLGGNGAGTRIIHGLQTMDNYPPNQSE